ncbi:hypothetical protein EUX98_g9323 [Antrodiella citrinella]|uniref:Uncharacterized protein n=1 Tax=Antrodiella citrinella TaxID=2447956 RepID=A0A4S4LWS0_9APHY|nr:hypothetical protein EUX98_g9323 [Antrodiella citrinella]
MSSAQPVPFCALSRTILYAPANGVTEELRQHMFNVTDSLARIESYGMKIIRSLKVTEMSLLQKEEELGKLEAKMVFETWVDTAFPLVSVCLDMLNDGENMHGGCSAFLIDL